MNIKQANAKKAELDTMQPITARYHTVMVVHDGDLDHCAVYCYEFEPGYNAYPDKIYE